MQASTLCGPRLIPTPNCQRSFGLISLPIFLEASQVIDYIPVVLIMATNVPAPLKTADVSRFVIRAAQVEKVKPAAAYWCMELKLHL